MALNILKNIKSAYKFINDNKDKSIALIPTMGALNEGHIALIKKAKTYNGNNRDKRTSDLRAYRCPGCILLQV